MSAAPSPTAARDEELKRRRVVEETARLEAQLRVKGLSSATLTEALELVYVSTNAMFGDVNARFAASGAFKAECAAGCSFCCHTMVTRWARRPRERSSGDASRAAPRRERGPAAAAACAASGPGAAELS